MKKLIIFALSFVLLATSFAHASQAKVNAEAEQKQQVVAQVQLPIEIEGEPGQAGEQLGQVEGQVEGVVAQVAVAQSPLEQQLAERRIREAERAKREKEGKEREAKHGQENVQDDAQAKRELAAVAHNGDVAEYQVEGANAQEQSAMFKAQGPDYLMLGQRDNFRSSDPEPILQVKTYEQLRLEKHGHNQSLILVRVFDGNCAYYYDANVFHEHINQGGRDVKNPNAPRSFLREITNKIHYFECKISGDESRKRILTLLCSYSQLTEDIRLGGELSKQFTSSGYSLPRVSALERRNNLGVIEVVELPRRPWPAGWRARCVEAGKLALLTGFPLVLGLVHGVINNALARRAGCGLQRWRWLDAPAREWVTKLGFSIPFYYWCKYLDDEVRLGPRASKWAVFGAFLGSGLFQEIGENFPLPGSKGQWRSFPIGAKAWEFNVSLTLAAATIIPLCRV